MKTAQTAPAQIEICACTNAIIARIATKGVRLPPSEH